jgi:hypothetical protein
MAPGFSSHHSLARYHDAVNDGCPPPDPRRSYRWPWYLLGAVILGLVLAILWLWPVVQRIRQQRLANPPAAASEPATRN